MGKKLSEHERYLRTISEAGWQNTVIDMAHRLGWLVFFVPDRLYRQGFIRGIPIDLGDKGFPDIIAVHPLSGRLVFRELKREGKRNDLSDHQIMWRDALLKGGHDWALWTPSDSDEAEADFRKL